MKYLTIHYNEKDQKVKRTLPTVEVDDPNFQFIGTMTGVELDFLVECLSERYGEADITYKQFHRYFSQTRAFSDDVKKITSDE